MFFNPFTKLTPINGFSEDLSNARQNDYAWAMDELGDYLYVGTGRNIPNLAFRGVGLPVPDAFLPDDDDRAEIWRVRKDGSKNWKLDFKTEERSFGFRFMIQYPRTERCAALYASATSSDGSKAVIYRRKKDPDQWREFARLEGETSRSMVEHNGRLYVATVPLAGTSEEPKLFILNKSRTAFDRVPLPSRITGEIVSMISFNGHLYLGLAKQGGFDLWRTNRKDPSSGWKLVIDKGAGDAINIIPFVMDEFDGSIYLGTGMVPFLPLLNNSNVITKGFDIIRVDKDDRWRVIVGGVPKERTKTITGRRNLSLYPSGFGNPFNAYCWQVRKHKDTLYAGSFDWAVVIPPALQSLLKAIRGEHAPSLKMNRYTNSLFLGFDLWKSENGKVWIPVSLNGFGNPKNYGARNLFSSENDHLYLGTANPFEGCEVWVKDDSTAQSLIEKIFRKQL